MVLCAIATCKNRSSQVTKATDGVSYHFKMALDLNQKTFMVEAYFRNGRKDENNVWQYSIPQCVGEFREQFPDYDFDYDMFVQNVKRLIKRFRETGSYEKGKGTGRPKKLTEPVLENIENKLRNSPKKSLRKLAQETNLSRSTCHKAARKELKLYPYKCRVVQELLAPDFPKRVTFCNWFNNIFVNDDDLDLVFFSDESWFHLSGYVNSQISRMWCSENPHSFIETSLHPVKIGVWLAVSRRRIIGPIFFRDTINGIRYRQLILEPFIEQLMDDELESGYFQQDGATAHTTADNINYLNEFFVDRVISSGMWPARSPDLTPLDFSIFACLKNNVFKTPLHTVDELQEKIIEQCNLLNNSDFLQRVFQSLRKRINLCLEQRGGHFEQLL